MTDVKKWIDDQLRPLQRLKKQELFLLTNFQEFTKRGYLFIWDERFEDYWAREGSAPNLRGWLYVMGKAMR